MCVCVCVCECVCKCVCESVCVCVCLLPTEETPFTAAVCVCHVTHNWCVVKVHVMCDTEVTVSHDTGV